MNHAAPTPMPSQGTPVYIAPAPAPTLVSPGIALPENPLRAIVVAAALFAAIIISTFFAAGWGQDDMGYLEVIYLTLVGFGAYLITRPGILPKVTAGAIALLAPIAYSAAFVIHIKFVQILRLDPLALFQDGNFMIVPGNLGYAVCVIAAAFGLSFAFQKTAKHQVGLTALCVGAAAVLISFLIGITTGFGNIPAVFLMRFLGEIPAGLVVGLAFVLASMFCAMKSYDLETRIGHKIWFGVCLTFTSISFVVTFLGGYIGSMFFAYSGFILGLLTIAGIVGYAQLLMSKRIGYLLILLATGTMFFGVLLPNFLQLISFLAYGGGQPVLNLTNIASSFGTIVNPAITGIVLLFIWKKVSFPRPYFKADVHVAFKVFAIASVVIGTVLFLLGCAGFFNPYAIRAGTTPPTVLFLLGVVLGAGTTVVGIYATLACFRRRSKAPLPLLITNCALTGLALISLVILSIA